MKYAQKQKLCRLNYKFATEIDGIPHLMHFPKILSYSKFHGNNQQHINILSVNCVKGLFKNYHGSLHQK